MTIHEYGEIVLCNNISFEDKQIDIESGHPGIVLLPTSENEEDIYCLYMTTDKERADREDEKYVKISTKVARKSYINIQQIVKRMNVKDASKNRLDDDEFRELLQIFYNYQVNLEPKKQEFLEIKSKIETLLEILKLNEEFNITSTISRKEIDALATLAKVESKIKRKMFYGAFLSITGDIDNQNLEEKLFSSGKDRIYFKNIVKTYNMLNCLNLDRIDFNNPNNDIRQMYFKLRNENHLTNVSTLFRDVSTLFSITNKNVKIEKLIGDFLDFEQKREIAEIKAKTEKIARKKSERAKNISQKRNKRIEEKNKRYEEIYGKFDW